jgi:FG-GAP-like repeat/FlgD Ig-like domain/FG-GAP repeat
VILRYLLSIFILASTITVHRAADAADEPSGRVASDGLISSPAWIVEGDQEEAWLGVSVATAGDVNGDGFSDVIVGAYLYDNGEADEGQARVYHGSAVGLASSPAWVAEGNQTEGWFGYSVGSAGDVNGDGFSDVVVGAWLHGENQEGRAFVYYGSASGLSASPGWTAESNQTGAHYGISVGTAGDVNGDGFSDVIVGAWHYSNGQEHEGRSFVYHGSASGLETTAAWTGESGQEGGYLGISVGTAGDVNGDGFSDVIAGAQGYDNGQVLEGRAFVYHGSEAGLEAAPAWTAESNYVGAYMGNAVGTAGDVNGDGFSDAIVGAYLYDNGETEEGRVYAYYGSAIGLSASPSWIVEGNLFAAYLGTSVGSAGDVNDDGFDDAIIGAFLYESRGQAFVYHGSAAGLAPSPNWVPDGAYCDGELGISVRSAGDVNGDGLPDVIVGAWAFSDEEFNEGRALAFHASSAATSTPGGSTPIQELALEEANPNPFVAETELRYVLPERGRLGLAIYDAAGRRVALLAERTESAGRHAVQWNGRTDRGVKLPPGVYFARLDVSGRVKARKLILAR